MKTEDSIKHQSNVENAYWLALQDQHQLISTENIIRVFYEFGSLSPFWNAPYSYFQRLKLDDKRIRKFIKYINNNRLQNFADMLKSLERKQIEILRYVDKEYPRMLKNTMKDPPLLLLRKGSLLNFDNCVAIVGTRNPSLYGRLMARKLSKSIASKGYTIVSGLARGVDEWAHCGALEAPRGKTIAVLAWMEPMYPQEHSELAEEIQKRGAILSEYFKRPLNRSAPSKFIQRNRITSGLSRCVIAIESDKEGGTVHQVKIALSQNRKVFALKPKNNEKAKRGFELFMDVGATPIKSAKEILDFLKEEMPTTAKVSRLDAYYQHSLDKIL